MPKKRPAEERFWKYVDKASDPRGCWLWIGGSDSDGYGRFRGENSVMIRAHRFSWQLHRGQIPPGFEVLHTCDNPPCVNPLHLFLGTNELNVIDKVCKGRTARGAKCRTKKLYFGESNWKSKLTSQQVADIRELRRSGVGTTELARRFGVNRATIQRIVSGKSWKTIAM
jgi:HNH endonuclease